MKKIARSKDHWGDYVIYVEKCDKYEYENPEIPKTDILVYIMQNNDILSDILNSVEDYFYSG